MSNATYLDLARQYHGQMPPRIRAYLNARGITDDVIARFLLGFDGERITIPVFDRECDFAFFRYARDPERPWGPKMRSQPGAWAELYGWEHVREDQERLVVCEGEFDRLVLEGRGIAAVTGTGGALVFLPEWAEALRSVPNLYVCYDHDAAGRAGARRVASLLPHARVVQLPDELGLRGDVTDFFVKLKRTREDFLALLDAAEPLPPEPESQDPPRRPWQPFPGTDAAELQARVRLEEVVGEFVTLRRTGQVLKGRCPFHDDRVPSFVVYPGSQTFHCFGCRAHGDALAFVQKYEGLTFGQALEVIRRLAGP
ncbi:MAG: toprim domain-containing protein [Acidobacteria bacterium]|nr:toprim domain-containing protein [Acidobacteriota bacterium]